MVIYKITNLKNGNIYIGQDSKNRDDYLGSGIAINKAIKKYGKENFIKNILINCNSKDEMNKMEIFFISYFKSLNYKLYNMTLGGDGLLGYSHTIESKNKIGKASKEIYRNELWKKRISISHMGDNNPAKQEYVRNKIRNTIKNKRWINNGIINKYINVDKLNYYISIDWIRGRVYKKYSKERISWNKGIKMSKEFSEKLSKVMIGKNKGKKGWNKGLTKETDIRVKNNGLNISIAKHKKIKESK